MPVKSPMRNTTVCPRSWNWRSFRKPDGMPEVDVGRGRVEPLLDDERFALGERPLELAPQVLFGNDLDGTLAG